MTGKKKALADELSLPQQNYVEAIAELIDDHGHAHPAKIAEQLKVRKPSVTEAVGRLVELGIARRSNQEVYFTKKGELIADELSGRHEALLSFMVKVLGMDEKDADKAACRMEHNANPRFIKRLKMLQDFMQRDSNSDVASKWFKDLDAAT